MDVFMKNRFVRWTIIVLVLLNVSTLAMLWFVSTRRPTGPPEHPRQRDEEAARFLQEELQLDDDQFQEYLRLRDAHRNRADRINRTLMELKREMLGELFHEHPDTVRAFAIARRTGSLQVELERITLMHFMELKDLCGIEQKDKLESLLQQFFHQHRPGRPPGPEGQPPPRHEKRPLPRDGHRPPPRRN